MDGQIQAAATRKSDIPADFLNPTRVFVLTAAAMAAFAANSLLCRLAFKETTIDAASFTSIRLVSGALVLFVIARLRRASLREAGHWLSALALFAYAATFSFAYLSLPAGTGALLLFGAVQATMILWGFRCGERLHAQQLFGLAAALAGLVTLVFPGVAAPPPGGAILMLIAGFSWGVYSLRGKQAGDPIAATASNFLRAAPMALAAAIVLLSSAHIDTAGVCYAVLSGAIASGVGYVIWYTVLPNLKPASAASVQLSVPVLTAGAGILLLGEPLTLRFIFAALAVLGGIALVVTSRSRARDAAHIV